MLLDAQAKTDHHPGLKKGTSYHLTSPGMPNFKWGPDQRSLQLDGQRLV
jgi:hypothetical protein